MDSLDFQMIANLVLPFPPSVNGLYGGGSRQKRFPSKKYKQWLASCPELPDYSWYPVRITYSFYFPDNRERDTENYVKAVSDYLVKQGTIKDDNWRIITSMLLLPMGIDRKNPRVEIRIEKHD